MKKEILDAQFAAVKCLKRNKPYTMGEICREVHFKFPTINYIDLANAIHYMYDDKIMYRTKLNGRTYTYHFLDTKTELYNYLKKKSAIKYSAPKLIPEEFPDTLSQEGSPDIKKLEDKIINIAAAHCAFMIQLSNSINQFNKNISEIMAN